jgi:SAM-dependent methyltransferase
MGNWDNGAIGYDRGCGHGLRTRAERDAWLSLLRRLLGHDRSTVVDVGTGTGFLALLLTELGHHVRGFDTSAGMLDIARHKAAADGIEARFEQADAAELPLESASCDAVVSRMLLWTLPEPERSIAEWYRVLRPGGTVLAFDSLAGGPSRVRDRLYRADLLVEEVCRGRRPRIRPAGLPLKGQLDPRGAENAFWRAGLCDVRSEQLPWLDAIERAAMRPVERMRHYSRRYLVEGRKPDVSG